MTQRIVFGCHVLVLRHWSSGGVSVTLWARGKRLAEWEAG